VRPPAEVIRDWYATLAAGKVADALAMLDPEIEWIEAESSPYGERGPLSGPEAVLDEVWRPLQRDWERIAVEPQELIELPSGVLALIRYRGIRRGTGARLDAQGAHLWDVRGERVTRFRGFADTHALQVATGTLGEPNRRLAREEFEIWNTGEVDRLDRMVAENVVHHDPHDPYAAEGLEGLKASISATRRRFRSLEISVLDQVAEADKVASRWRATMTPMGATEPTSEGPREVSMTGITIERFENGKVVESWRSMDRLGLLGDLGVLPRPASDG
jgi:ketosteroid isomerase-like protein